MDAATLLALSDEMMLDAAFIESMDDRDYADQLRSYARRYRHRARLARGRWKEHARAETQGLVPVIVESPFAAPLDTPTEEITHVLARNISYVRACMRECLKVHHEAPFASHALYTLPGVLDNLIPEERDLGIEAGLQWGAFARRSVVYTDLGISKGMWKGIARALGEGRELVLRRLQQFSDFELVFGARSVASEAPTVERITRVYESAAEAVARGAPADWPAVALHQADWRT